MTQEVILFFNEGVEFLLRDKGKVRLWLHACAKAKKRRIGSITYIFCNDAFLRKINKKFLAHDYNTDIITFPDGDSNSSKINGEMYISIDRVRANAHDYGTSFKEELHRVMAHGLLHLCGEKDTTKQQSQRMRAQEDLLLGLR